VADQHRWDLPHCASLGRMVATLLQEQDGEWQVADRRYFSAASMAQIDAPIGDEIPRELLAAIAQVRMRVVNFPPLDGIRPVGLGYVVVGSTDTAAIPCNCECLDDPIEASWRYPGWQPGRASDWGLGEGYGTGLQQEH
jgi:hypothetical protein